MTFKVSICGLIAHFRRFDLTITHFFLTSTSSSVSIERATVACGAVGRNDEVGLSVVVRLHQRPLIYTAYLLYPILDSRPEDRCSRPAVHVDRGRDRGSTANRVVP